MFSCNQTQVLLFSSPAIVDRSKKKLERKLQKNDANKVVLVKPRVCLCFGSNCSIRFEGSLGRSQFSRFSGAVPSQTNLYISYGMHPTFRSTFLYMCLLLDFLKFLVAIVLQLKEKFNSLETRVSNLESAVSSKPAASQV